MRQHLQFEILSVREWAQMACTIQELQFHAISLNHEHFRDAQCVRMGVFPDNYRGRDFATQDVFGFRLGHKCLEIAGRFGNPIIQRDEPSWQEFCEILLEVTSSTRLTEIDGLTKRDLDVFRLICRALSGNEIAKELQMSEKTVRNHTSNIYAKLDVQNRQQAIREFGHLF